MPLLLVSLTLAIGGCATAPDVPMTGATNDARRATQLMQEREQEVAALRAEMASTRIVAAKQEAELQELRTTVVQLRQENGESHQALLQANRILAARETEVAAMKAERDQLAHASVHSGRTERHMEALQDRVESLSGELAELKSVLALAMHKPAGSAEGHDDAVARTQTGRPSVTEATSFAVSPENTTKLIVPAVQVLREEADQSKPSWITVQPGESWWSLARKYHTTMNALRAMNGRVGDHLNVGEALRLP